MYRPFLLIALITTSGLQAQQNFTIAPESEVAIYGTSNVHDWSEHCETFTGGVEVNTDQPTPELSNLRFKVEVRNIKSGKSTMDGYTYDALLMEKFPVISYKSNNINTIGTTLSMQAIATGEMTIAGTTRTEKVTATCTYTSAGMKCTGQKTIDMTLYGIEPPSIMFGAMTVGKEVEIIYEIIFKTSK